jgi:septum formation protein
MQPEHPPLVLASGSGARRGLLEGAGLRFVVQPTELDEAAVKQQARAAGESAEQAALRLALAKAAAVSAQAPDALVIGADQILVCRAAWYDKPADLASARTQLLELRGRTHGLATAVACVRAGQPVWQHVETPRLAMRAFSAEFLDAYLAVEGDRVLGSVGAYRLEGPGVLLFDRVQGDHSAILGLPLVPLLRFLRDSGLLLA